MPSAGQGRAGPGRRELRSMGRGALAGLAGLAVGLACLASGLPRDWPAAGCFLLAILWLEQRAVELGGQARYLPSRPVYLGAGLYPEVGPAFAAALCLLNCALQPGSRFLLAVEERLGVLLALALLAVGWKLGLEAEKLSWVAYLVGPSVCVWLTLSGPARDRFRLSTEDRLRWQRARLHTRSLESKVALAGPALAVMASHYAALPLLLVPLLGSTQQAAQSLVIEAQKDEAGEAYKALTQVQAQQQSTAHKLQQAERDKQLLEGFSRHLSRHPDLSSTASSLLKTVLELLKADDVALFLVSPSQRLEPFHYRVQPDHEARLQACGLTGVGEPVVDRAWQSQQSAQDGGGDLESRLFHHNNLSVAIPLGQHGVLYVGRVQAQPFSGAELHSLQWLGDKARMALGAALRQQETGRQQQRQRSTIVGLQRQLQVTGLLMQGAQEMGSTLKVQQVLERLSSLLAAHLPHEQRLLSLGRGLSAQLFSQPDRGADTACLEFLEKVGESGLPLLIGDLSGSRLGAAFPGMKSLIAAPLLAEERAGGAVALLHSEPESFTREQSELLLLLASQAAMALSRAGLYEEVVESRRRLEESQAQLIQTSKLTAIGQLASGIAHELNTPLGAVGLSMATAQECLDSRPDRAIKMLDLAQVSLDKAVSIIDKLLVYSRKPPEQMEAVALTELVHDTLELVTYPLRTANVQAETRLQSGLLVMGRAQELQQVLLNLILNAQQAVKDQPESRRTVVISSRARGDLVALEVTDQGVGIEPATLERVFEPFFTTRQVGEGTGLGLSICHQILDLHRGRLEVRSEVGKGTTFSMLLPAASG